MLGGRARRSQTFATELYNKSGVFRGAFEDRTEHGNQIDASPASREREAEGRGQPLHKYLIGRPRLWLRQAETIAASPKTQRSRRSLRSGSLSLRTLDE